MCELRSSAPVDVREVMSHHATIVNGSIAQTQHSRSAALGLIPGIPKKISDELLMLLRLITSTAVQKSALRCSAVPLKAAESNLSVKRL